MLKENINFIKNIRHNHLTIRQSIALNNGLINWQKDFCKPEGV